MPLMPVADHAFFDLSLFIQQNTVQCCVFRELQTLMLCIYVPTCMLMMRHLGGGVRMNMLSGLQKVYFVPRHFHKRVSGLLFTNI